MLSSKFTDWASTAESRSLLPKINNKDLNTILTPIPPVQEQAEIVRRVEEYFELADSIEAKINAVQVHINFLTQSILYQAFKGNF